MFSAILYHDIDNLSWLTFPVGGSYFDPRVTGLIVLCLAIVVVVVAPWKRLSRPSGAPT